jgi:hypothetical protein
MDFFIVLLEDNAPGLQKVGFPRSCCHFSR